MTRLDSAAPPRARLFSVPWFRRHSARLITPRQAAALPPLGALLGLLIALPGLIHRNPPALTAVPEGVIALVNQRPILTSDYMTQIESETSQPFDEVSAERRAQVLHEMIDQELIVQRSLALDLPENDTDVREALANGMELQWNSPVLARRVSDDTLRAYYNAHRSRYATNGTMRVRNLVLHVGGYQNADQSLSQALEDATEAAFQLRAGTSLQDVMDHFGFVDAPNADTGDQFDFAAKLHLGTDLFDVAQTMNSGDVSEPVEQPDGVHLLLMVARQPPHISDFDHVRAAVYSDYRRDEEAQTQIGELALLRQGSRIVLAPGASE